MDLRPRNAYNHQRAVRSVSFSVFPFSLLTPVSKYLISRFFKDKKKKRGRKKNAERKEKL